MLKKTLRFAPSKPTLTIVAILAISVSIGLAVFSQSVVRADATSDLESQISRYQYYNQLVNEDRCSFKTDVTGKDIDIYNFYQVWSSRTVVVGLIAKPGTGGWNCGDLNTTSDLSRAFAGAIGLDASDPGELLCQLGYKQKVASSASNKTSCADNNTSIGGTDSFHIDNPGTEIKNYLLSHSLKNNEPQWTDAMAYWSTFQDFIKGCSAKQVSSGSYGNTVANIRTVDSAGVISMKGYSYAGSGNLGFFSAENDINQTSSTVECAKLIRGLDAASPAKYAQAYQTLLFEQACKETYPGSDNLVSACVKGAQNPSDVEYCPNTYRNVTAAREACYTGQGNQGAEVCTTLGYTKNNGLLACIRGSQNSDNASFCNAEYPAPDSLNSSGQLPTDTNKSLREACLKGQENPAGGSIAVSGPDLTQIGGGDENNTPPTCGDTVESIGWILCPVLKSVAGLNDEMWGFASALLMVSPIQQSDGGNYIPQYGGTYTQTYVVWQAFRNIANVALVIVFLIMIFSQLTNAGISNYGIKKTLPRLVIAAIAINASFFVIQISVDVFNILGKGIYDIIDNLVTIPQPTWDQLLIDVLASGLTIAGIVGTVAIAPQWALMLIIIPALSAFIALLAAMLTLLFRQAIIPILAVLAPLAFVAYLLPNTKSWFDKWKNMLISMLMLFPLAALLFGGVKLSASILIGQGGAWGAFAALIVLTVPLFMLPFIARQTGPMLGKINSAIKGAGDKLVGKPVGAWADRRKALSLAKSDASEASNYNLLKRARQGLGRSRKRTELRTDAYKAQGNAEYNSYLAENAGALAGTVEGSAAQAHIRGAGARAEAEELKLAMVPLEQEVAEVRAGKHKSFAGTDVGAFLEARANDNSRSSSEKEAAMHKIAALGRDKVIRRLQNNASADQTALQRAITANPGALAGKAADIVKGPEAAFKSFTGADMAQWSDGTAEAFMQHYESLVASGDTEGANGLLQVYASAVRDLQNNPALQAAFSGDAGNMLKKQAERLANSDLAKSNPALKQLGNVFTSIGPDGKIR